MRKSSPDEPGVRLVGRSSPDAAPGHNHPDRRNLTFAQREGLEPLPRQLDLREISDELRAYVAHTLHASMSNSKVHVRGGGVPAQIGEPWRGIMYDAHVRMFHFMPDEFSTRWDEQWRIVKYICQTADYEGLFGFIEHIIRHHSCPALLEETIARDFVQARAAYTVVDSTIVPKATEEEGEAIEQAFADLSAHGLSGARTHLRTAAERLNEGNYADSIRESIHAVEAVARTLDPTANTLDPALKTLAKAADLHPALQAGFSKIYGYTSDEDGIRHALVERGDANADEADALFMIGACAAFISYLIGKAEGAGIAVR